MPCGGSIAVVTSCCSSSAVVAALPVDVAVVEAGPCDCECDCACEATELVSDEADSDRVEWVRGMAGRVAFEDEREVLGAAAATAAAPPRAGGTAISMREFLPTA